MPRFLSDLVGLDTMSSAAAQLGVELGADPTIGANKAVPMPRHLYPHRRERKAEDGDGSGDDEVDPEAEAAAAAEAARREERMEVMAERARERLRRQVCSAHEAFLLQSCVVACCERMASHVDQLVCVFMLQPPTAPGGGKGSRTRSQAEAGRATSASQETP